MRQRRALMLAILAGGLLWVCPSVAQDEQPVIRIVGAVKEELTLSAADLSKMPRASVRTTSNGMGTVYEGVWRHEILKKAGVPQGLELRRKALASYVLVEAQDGYQGVFSLAELDPSFVDRGVMPADTANGKALVGAQGRFRLVASKDKAGARSVRLLTKIEVVQVRK